MAIVNAFRLSVLMTIGLVAYMSTGGDHSSRLVKRDLADNLGNRGGYDNDRLVKRDVDQIGQYGYTGCNSQGNIAMIYAGGPATGTTTNVISALKTAGIKATFFVQGSSVQYPEGAAMARSAYLNGNLIGMAYVASSGVTTADQIKSDMLTQSNWIYKVLGQYPKYVKVNDATSKAVAQGLNLVCVSFAQDTMDYAAGSTAQSIGAAYGYVIGNQTASFSDKGKWIFLNNDVAANSAGAVPYIASAISGTGYTNTRIDQCLGDSTPYKTTADGTTYIADPVYNWATSSSSSSGGSSNGASNNNPSGSSSSSSTASNASVHNNSAASVQAMVGTVFGFVGAAIAAIL